MIFNILRAGLWENGAGGSGVVVARQPDGTWTPPAALKCSTPEVGVVLGADIFDSVLVLNTQESLDAFKRGFCVIGRDIYSVTGPLDVGWFLEASDHARNAPIFSYFRSQQHYADVQAEDFAFSARDEENQNFYSPQMIGLSDILAGKVRSPPGSINGLLECLRASQGDKDIDESIITQQAPPSDFTMVEEGQAFAIPDVEDPDQYGYAALEKYGIVVVDAATKSPVAADEFEFHPSMKSPAFEKYHRKGDNSSISGRSNWRQSTLSGFDRQDTVSTRSRNSMIGSSAPTSPPAVPSTVEHQIKLEDNEEAPTLKSHEDGSLYANGKNHETDEDDVDAPRGRPISVQRTRQSRAIAPVSEAAAAAPDAITARSSVIEERPVTAGQNVDESVYGVSSVRHSIADQPSAEFVTTNGASASEAERSPSGSTNESSSKQDMDDGDESDTFEDLDEDFEIHDASETQPTTAVTPGAATAVSLSQAKVVNVNKATTPSLPVRNPVRLTMMSPPTSSSNLANENAAEFDNRRKSAPVVGDGAQGETKANSGVSAPKVDDSDTSAPVSPVSFSEAQEKNARSRSISPEPPMTARQSATTNSLAAMRRGLGTPSPERSPER